MSGRAFVRFRTDGARYVVPVSQVREILPSSDIVRLPSPREGVAGIIQRGDQVITVLSVLGRGRDHVIVVVDSQGGSFGLYAEEVLGIVELDDAAIEPPPPGQDRRIVDGMVLGDEVDLLVSPRLIWEAYGE